MDARIFKTVYLALDEVNSMLPPERQVAKAGDAPLAEPRGPLNSLGLVNLVVALEAQVEQAFGQAVNLAEAGSETTGESPFSTVSTLARHVETQLRGPATA